jgi:hypothetical protein
MDESKELISATKASLQNLYLKGLQMNNQDRKAELIELLCAALPEFAALVLFDCELEDDLEPHDLVADLLLQHHEDTASEKFLRAFLRGCLREL